MEKGIWSDTLRDHGHIAIDLGGLDAARGLLIGLAISQVFWLVLAYFVL